MKNFLMFISMLLILIPIYTESIDGRITDIIVEGNHIASSEYIIRRSNLDIGYGLNTEDISNAIKNLFSTGMFENVIIEQKQSGMENVLIIKVKEYPRIDKIIIKGNKKKKTKDIKEHITITEGSFASSNNIFQIKDELKKFYDEQGYLNASFDIQIEEKENNRVNVIILVTENEIVRIKHIEIFGNYKVTDNYVKSKMKTKERGFLKEGLFKKDEFEEDKKIIISSIKEKGFPDAKIDSVNIKYSSDLKSMFISIYVNQGRQYKVGDITFEGNKNIDDKIIKQFIKYKKGELYNQTKLDNMIAALYEYYMNNGYLYVSIMPVDNRHDSIIDINLKIEENNQAIVRYIDITGNKKTEESVIRREIIVLPGDIFKRNELVLTHSNLFRMGYFEDVQINPIPDKEKSIVDIVFNVKEKQTGEFNVGMTFNQLDGFTGNIKVGLKNLLGKGLSTSLQFEKGQSITNFQFSFTEPYLLNYPLLLGLNAYYYTKNMSFYNDRRVGGQINTGYTLSKRYSLKLNLSYKLENVYLYTDSITESLLDPWIKEQIGESRWLSQISPSIVRDTRNHYFFPDGGLLAGLYFNFAGGIIGGETDFYKMVFDFRVYQKIVWKFVFMLRTAIGFVDGYTDPNTVPMSERFTLGGVGFWGLRGYYDRRIGPYIEGYCIGGRGAGLINVELRMKLNEQAFLLAFYDIGNAWENMTGAYNNRFQPIYQGIGLGVRMEIPMMGIMGIDIGYGFTDTRSAGGGQWEPHFQIGSSY